MNRTFNTALALALGFTTLISTADIGFARSKSQYCRSVARHEANNSSGRNVGTGLVAGAATGGVIGALTGQGRASNIATGLAVGGAGGALVGAASGNAHRDEVYRRVYEDCMYN